jgi:hypothetical protein
MAYVVATAPVSNTLTNAPFLPSLDYYQVVRIFNTSDGMQVATQRHSQSPVLAVDISPCGVTGISSRCALARLHRTPVVHHVN